MTSEDAQCSSRSGFRIFKISCEVRVLKQSQPALFSSLSSLPIAEIADIEQTEKIVPFITCDVALCQLCLRVGFLVSSIFDLDFLGPS